MGWKFGDMMIAAAAIHGAVWIIDHTIHRIRRHTRRRDTPNPQPLDNPPPPDYPQSQSW